ncbi:MAG: AAA family ATPase [Syntrophales bacterium]|jgi:dephospho-CoA kinase|nr:AAA family ATPase [Syntrophales bacterium]MDY0043879.1 AAA family ATPase [Syntrophales bacterium]
MKVIGTIGKNGSGKDEVLKYMKRAYGIPFFSTGDMVRTIASKEGVEPTRENLREISERYFKKNGEGYFVKLLGEKIKNEQPDITGISGIRSFSDVNILKNMFGPDFILIKVDVGNPRLRYERMVARAEERDPADYEQFLAQDKAEEELFRLEEASEKADYTVKNDGTLNELHKAVDELAAKSNIF